DRAAAVVAGHEIGALADQLDHQHRLGECGQQLFTAARTRRQAEVARTRARRSADPARSMTGRSDAELARGGTVRDPAGEDAVRDELPARHPEPLAVERPRAQPAPAQRVVDDGYAVREHALAEFVEQEAGLAGDRRPGDRAGEVTEQTRRHPRVENHRIAPRL